MPKQADAGREDVPERERGEGRVAAGAAAFDGQPLRVDVAALDEEAGRRDAVVDVDDAPLAVEPAGGTRGRSRCSRRSPRPRRRCRGWSGAASPRSSAVSAFDGRAAVRQHDERRPLARPGRRTPGCVGG